MSFLFHLLLYFTTTQKLSSFFFFYYILAAEAKNCLDGRFSRDDALNNFVKPPANLLVMEGDCLDTSGDAGELESFLVV